MVLKLLMLVMVKNSNMKKPPLTQRFIDYLRGLYLKNGGENWVKRDVLKSLAEKHNYSYKQISTAFKNLSEIPSIGHSEGKYVYYNLPVETIKNLKKDLKWFKNL